MREYYGPMTDDWMRDVVFDDHSQSRAAFVAVFPSEVDRAISALTLSYAGYQDLWARFPEGERSAVVFSFLHLANNSLISALHLLISGFLAPAGNLMRQFAEATAMTLLCAEKSNGTLEHYLKQGFNYPVHKAIDRLSKRKFQQAIGIEAEGWRSFKEISSFYDSHSHASDMSIAANIIFDHPGKVILAGQFDPGKSTAYKIELSRISSAAASLRSALVIVERNLVRADAS